MKDHGVLSRAIAVVLQPDRASFEAEPRLRLFELVRWSLLGGDYEKRKNASGVIYAAAEIACLGDDPVDGFITALRHRQTRMLLQETMSRYDFYHLLAANDHGLRRSMDKKQHGQLRDAVGIAGGMLSIRQAGHSASVSKVIKIAAARTHGVQPFSMRARTSLSSAGRRYKPQLSFLRPLMLEPGLAPLRLERSRTMPPASLISALAERIEDGRARHFLAHAKATAGIIDAPLARLLSDAWAGLPPASPDSLNIRNLTAAEQAKLIKQVRRPASETRKTDRLKPPVVAA